MWTPKWFPYSLVYSVKSRVSQATMPSQDEQHQYFQVSEDDNESSKFIPYIDSKPIPTTRRRSFIKLLPWLLHLLLITGYFFFALHFLDQGKSECFDGIFSRYMLTNITSLIVNHRPHKCSNHMGTTDIP